MYQYQAPTKYQVYMCAQLFSCVSLSRRSPHPGIKPMSVALADGFFTTTLHGFTVGTKQTIYLPFVILGRDCV